MTTPASTKKPAADQKVSKAPAFVLRFLVSKTASGAVAASENGEVVVYAAPDGSIASWRTSGDAPPKPIAASDLPGTATALTLDSGGLRCAAGFAAANKTAGAVVVFQLDSETGDWAEEARFAAVPGSSAARGVTPVPGSYFGAKVEFGATDGETLMISSGSVANTGSASALAGPGIARASAGKYRDGDYIAFSGLTSATPAAATDRATAVFSYIARASGGSLTALTAGDEIYAFMSNEVTDTPELLTDTQAYIKANPETGVGKWAWSKTFETGHAFTEVAVTGDGENIAVLSVPASTAASATPTVSFMMFTGAQQSDGFLRNELIRSKHPRPEIVAPLPDAAAVGLSLSLTGNLFCVFLPQTGRYAVGRPQISSDAATPLVVFQAQFSKYSGKLPILPGEAAADVCAVGPEGDAFVGGSAKGSGAGVRVFSAGENAAITAADSTVGGAKTRKEAGQADARKRKRVEDTIAVAGGIAAVGVLMVLVIVIYHARKK